jgi:hypothetical protein
MIPEVSMEGEMGVGQYCLFGKRKGASRSTQRI